MTTSLPPDQSQRELIFNNLDSNMLVEAAAGTGKTTSMVGRMVALLAQDKCKVGTIAAVTFTKKSASELRSRFQAELVKRARSAESTEKALLQEAVANIEQCFIGTIHSFCGRLLRERPVEAGVDVAFEEIDDVVDERIQQEAWNQFVAEALASQSTVLDELKEVGLQIGQLSEAFKDFVMYSDVDEWPSEEPKRIEFAGIAGALGSYVRHISEHESLIPTEPGNDKLSIEYRKLLRVTRQRDISDPINLMEILEQCKEDPKLIQKVWGKENKEFVKREKEQWDAFYESTIRPALEQWRERRYEVIMRVLHSAIGTYDAMRLGRGELNFQDLLIKSSELLAENSHVRRYFKKRFTHLLIDEFQDTDPIQAKLMMCLTATDDSETHWENCIPRPGSLFVVGDPKQSIYRFRRADIVTYNRVKEIIQESGGEIVTLSANFRTSPEILDWVNDIFTDTFPDEPTGHSPAYVPFDNGRQDGELGNFHGVEQLIIPGDYSKKLGLSIDFEADAIAQTIARALEDGMTVTRSVYDMEKGMSREVTPGDFLIVTRGKKNMSVYAQKLGALGIPHEVTGGTVLNETPQIALLYSYLNTLIHPDDPVALVNLLRSESFGVSDRALYRFKKAGGRFRFTSKLPENMEADDYKQFSDAYSRLKGYANWLDHLPYLSALERIVQDSGLLALAASGQSGNVNAGSLEKVLEIVRNEQQHITDVSELVELLKQVVESELEQDGIIAGSAPDSVVRIMNLHKVKGLEAPVVFLANTKGQRTYPVKLYIDRSDASKTRGYMSIHGEPVGFQRPLLAHPHNWEAFQNAEVPFQEAEEDRLLYVAATRAGSNLVISGLEGSKRNHFWNFFSDALLPKPAFEPLPVETVVEQQLTTIARNDFSSASENIHTGLTNLVSPTFSRASAKTQALADSTPPNYRGEHGAEWGTLIHNLFEVVMDDPEYDLESFAIGQIEELGLSKELLKEALDTVSIIIQSDIWKRAKQSSRTLTEVPFQFTEPANSDTGNELPTIIRGVIDLVFEEDGEWVIVDYKTDTGAREHLEEYKAHYAPQLQSYARAWEHCTGKEVKETGLYFTASNSYTIN